MITQIRSTQITPSRRTRISLAALIALFLVGAPDAADAQDFMTWRSEATNGSWQGTINFWNFNTSQGQAISFGQQEWDNNHYTSQTNTSDISTWRWLFKSGASASHTFTGNKVRFYDYGTQDPSIINQSGVTHYINMNIEGDGDAADPLNIQIDNNNGGGLSFGGSVNNMGSDIRVIGTASSAATVTFNGVMSGNGGFYKENSNITVVMANANTYSGQTTIQGGTLRLAGSGSLANSAVRLHSGATLSISNSATVSSVAEYASQNSGVIAISNGAVLTVTANSTNIYQNSISGAGGLTKQGSHTLNLFGTQSYTGATTVSAGKLGTSVELGTAGVTTSGNGVFQTTASSGGLGSSAYIAVNGGEYIVGVDDSVGALSGNSATGKLTLDAQLITANDSDATFAGVIAGSKGLVKQGTGTLTFTGNSTSTGGLYIDNGALNLKGGANTFAVIDIGSGVSGGTQAGNNAKLRVESGTFSAPIVVNGETNSSGAVGNRYIEFANTSGSATLSGNASLEKTVSVDVGTGAASGVLSGVLSGNGGLTKTGSGTLTLSGGSANTYAGRTTVSAGVLELAKTVSNAVNGNLTVGSGTTDSTIKLLLSTSNQVGSSGGQTVTLSGGTIQRGSGVSEAFGNLNLTTASFLDFGTGTAGNLTFGTYTPSSLLTVSNFFAGDSLTFGSNLTGLIAASSSGPYENANFKFTQGFTSSWNGSTFTITAIPETSTVVAAIGLAGMMLWPARRRLMRDAKIILGIRRPSHARMQDYHHA